MAAVCINIGSYEYCV